MVIDKGKQRARWRRNKRDGRARQRREPREIDPMYERAVLFERDWRAAHGLEGISFWPERDYLYGDRAERAFAFTADVWAAEALVVAKFGRGKATPTRIAQMLKTMGRTHGYTEGSLRKTIKKAQERVWTQENKHLIWRNNRVSWPPFIPLLTPAAILCVLMNGNTKCACGKWLMQTIPGWDFEPDYATACVCEYADD